MNARHYLLGGTVLGATLIGASSLAFVAYSASYEAGPKTPAAASAVATPPQPVATAGLCSIPNISVICPVR